MREPPWDSCDVAPGKQYREAVSPRLPIWSADTGQTDINWQTTLTWIVSSGLVWQCVCNHIYQQTSRKMSKIRRGCGLLQFYISTTFTQCGLTATKAMLQTQQAEKVWVKTFQLESKIPLKVVARNSSNYRHLRYSSVGSRHASFMKLWEMRLSASILLQ